MKYKYSCEECGKQLKNKRALAGHMWFAHDKRMGKKAELEDEVKELRNGKEKETLTRVKEILEVVEGQSKLISEVLKTINELTDLVSVGNPAEEKKKLGESHNPEPKKKEEPDDEDDLDVGEHFLFGDDDDEKEEKKSEKTDETKKSFWEKWFL